MAFAARLATTHFGTQLTYELANSAYWYTFAEPHG